MHRTATLRLARAHDMNRPNAHTEQSRLQRRWHMNVVALQPDPKIWLYGLTSHTPRMSVRALACKGIAMDATEMSPSASTRGTRSWIPQQRHSSPMLRLARAIVSSFDRSRRGADGSSGIEGNMVAEGVLATFASAHLAHVLCSRWS